MQDFYTQNLDATGNYLLGLIRVNSGEISGNQQGLDILSGNLYDTGHNLYNLILTVSGIQQSGSTGVTQAELNATGNVLDTKINSLSGYDNTTFATLVNVTQTGVTLGAKVDSVSGYANNTFSTIINLVATGSYLYNTLIGISGTFTGSATAANLSATGSNLYILITGLSGQNNLDYATKVQLTNSGALIEAQINSLSGWAASATNLALTGQQAWIAADNNGRNLSGNLTQTGIILNAKIDNLSGYDTNTYATKIQLTNTGVIIEGQINSLSGFTTGISGALQAQIASAGAIVKVTGSNPLATADFSGVGGTIVYVLGNQVLISGGAGGGGGVTQGQLDSLSGWAASAVNLYATGSYLYNLATGLSGQLTNDLASKLNLALTGSNLYNLVTGTSGQATIDYATKISLTNSGVIIEGQINSLSGWAASAINLTQSGITLLNIIVLTGSQSWNAANNNGINLSGNLTQTGVIIEAQINSLSGFTLGVSGYLQNQITAGAGSVVKVSGSNPIPIADFTGIGNATVLYSGGQVFINAVGVTQNQLDSLSGWAASASNLTQTGVTLLSVIAATGQQSWLASNNNSINLSGNLQSTGSNLYNIIIGLSGQAIGSYATVFNLSLTGSNLYNIITGTSGQAYTDFALQSNLNTTNINLALTGSNLYIDLTGLSGQFNNNFSTNANLALTGSNLYNLLTGTSGQAVIDYATKVNLTLTGVAIENQITSLSGWAASAINLTQTGVTLLGIIANTGQQSWTAANNNGINLSGNLTSTGIALGSKIDSLSGYSASLVNLGLTGSILYNDIIGLSGQFNTNFATAANLAITGSNLYILVTGLSGSSNNTFATITNLYNTGSNLYNLVTGLSGQANINFATITNLALTGSNLYILVTGLSGAFNTQIASTGNQAWNAANNNGINLSGNLTLTGQTLLTKITSLSGFIGGVSGALQAQIGGSASSVKITGSATLTTADFTGIGGTLVFSSGNQVFISGSSGGGGGITQGQLDSLSGYLVTGYTTIGLSQMLWQTNYSP